MVTSLVFSILTLGSWLLALAVPANPRAIPPGRSLQRPLRPVTPPQMLRRPAPGKVTPASARPTPHGLTVDGQGGIYIADNTSHRVYRLDLETGLCTLIAGTGERGFSGDGGPATSAKLSFPVSVALDTEGNLYIADTANHRVRRVDAATGIITTVAGNGNNGFGGDGGPATEAMLNGPHGVGVDGAGRLYIADTNNNRVRVVEPTGVIRTVAGNGYTGFLGDTGRAVRANLSRPTFLAVSPDGILYISDTNNNRVRRVDPKTGIITRYAGSWTGQELGDRGPAHRARLNDPAQIALDARGNLYISDAFQHRVRRVDAMTGIITTVAGQGVQGSDGDGGPALKARIGRPSGLTVDPDGNVYVMDTVGTRLRKIDARTGIITSLTVPAPVKAVAMPAESAVR
jgi:sugar lactone lactonase YvrE